NANQLVDRLDHVHGDADGSSLVRDRPCYRLADPPRRVRRELVALRIVELLHRADQTEVALLDQVQEQHPATHVTLGYRDDQAQVRLDQLALGELTIALDPMQPILEGAAVLGPECLRDLLAPDALDLTERVQLVVADLPYALHDQLQLLLIDLLLGGQVSLQRR